MINWQNAQLSAISWPLRQTNLYDRDDMKLKLAMISFSMVFTSAAYADDCTQFFDEMDKFYETLHSEGISPERTAEYRNDIATSRLHHDGFTPDDKTLNNKYCKDELETIENTQSTIRDLFSMQATSE